jgi:hypothetical protein
MKLSAYGVVAFIHVMALFLLSAAIEDRARRRDYDASWQ